MTKKSVFNTHTCAVTNTDEIDVDVRHRAGASLPFRVYTHLVGHYDIVVRELSPGRCTDPAYHCL